MKYLPIIFFLVFSLNGVSQEESFSSSTADIMRAISITEEIAPYSLQGTFEIQVKASGRRKNETYDEFDLGYGQDFFYLNSEQDYRDRRNITIAIQPQAVEGLELYHGESPDSYFVGKTIEITGEAKQVKVWLCMNGKKTNVYYFQTHITVTSVEQIKVLG